MQEMTHHHTRELDVFYREHRKACTICERPFEDGMCAHLGYIKDNAPAVLCDNCAENLIETVARYHWTSDVYETPDGNDKLWRYMDLAKFIQMISSKTLYFAAAESFEDLFEGAKGLAARKDKWDAFYLDFFKKAIITAPGMDERTLTHEYVESNATRLLSEIDSIGKRERTQTFISCWHDNEYESEAMWKLYSADFRNAVAVQTTASHLYFALGRDPAIDIGKVNYIDFSKQFVPLNGTFWYKRLSFEHEHEVRAVIKCCGVTSSGIALPVDLKTLIDHVYVSPYASPWFEGVVSSVMHQYGLCCPLSCSAMAAEPFY